MTKPITPPPELVSKWCYEDGEEIKSSPRWFFSVCAKAAQWGADQELEACCEWFASDVVSEVIDVVSDLRAARRPKPLTLRELALASVKRFEESGEFFSDQMRELEFIRKALEQLND